MDVIAILEYYSSFGLRLRKNSKEDYLLGYSTNSKGFRVYNKVTRKVQDCLHVDFFEDQVNQKGKGPDWLFDLDILTPSLNYIPVRKENQVDTEAKGSNSDDIEDIDDLQFIVHGTSTIGNNTILEDVPNDVQNKDTDESATEKEVPLTAEEQALQAELVNMMFQQSIDNTQVDDQRRAFEVEKKRFASEKRKERAKGTSILNTARPNDVFESTSSTPFQSAADVDADLPHDPNMPGSEDINDDVNLRNLSDIDDDLPKDGIFHGNSFDDENTDTKENADPDLNNMDNTIDELKQENSYEEEHERVTVKKINNKARLVAQGYKQEEGVDYDEVFAPVARIKAIRLFLAFASFMGFLVYQMDVKSAFLYGNITKEVYVKQPPAPRAWYERLSTFLLQHGYMRGAIDKTLFIKKDKKDIMQVQVYVDDIIFGSTKPSMVKDFEELMQKEFKLSSMGELSFFLGLQVKQTTAGIFISQDKYVKDILNKFDFRSIKPATTPIEAHKALGKDEKGEDVDVNLYRSMIGCLMYLTASRPDIMFAVCLCARFQIVTMQGIILIEGQLLVDFNILEADWSLGNVRNRQLWLHHEQKQNNESTICIVKNPVFHSKTKHIQIRHHFIRDCYDQRLINVVKTERNAEFHHIIDFIAGCSVSYALLVDPDVIRPWIQQFWKTAKQQMIDDVTHIQAKVAGRTILVSEASIRADLLFNDEDGTECFANQLFLNKQLEGIDKPLSFLPSVDLPHKVFTFMSKNSPKFFGRVTGLTPHMLEVVAAVMGDATDPTHSHSNPSIGAEPTYSVHSIERSASPIREEEEIAQQSTAERFDSPNDYTPTDEVQTSGGDEENLDLYGLNREVIRLKKAYVKHQASLSKKKKLGKKHKTKSSSFKQGRKRSKGISGLNKVDIEEDIDWDTQDDDVKDQMDVEDATLDETSKVMETEKLSQEKQNDGTKQVDIGSEDKLNDNQEGAGKIDQSTARLQKQSTIEIVIESTDVPTTESTPVKDIAGTSTRHEEEESQPHEIDELFQDDTLIADILVNISRPRRGARITIPGNVPETERSESQTPVLDPKDKGKAIIKEEPKKKKLTPQDLRAAKIAFNEEAARRIQAELYEQEEKERLAGLERLQAKLEANEMIVEEMQRVERDNLTEEQKAKFLVEL
ncbi:putative ribonuclease H-like domain-containing protein [Tanacetum coccineum]